ncbi:hypothetical protein DENSPDRAFT_934700 [Dentipellis sp. KUC8613]|nr:hypothetical protein DENSPDRAFT_934700 [Dentipellis sp. KUC8613]
MASRATRMFPTGPCALRALDAESAAQRGGLLSSSFLLPPSCFSRPSLLPPTILRSATSGFLAPPHPRSLTSALARSHPPSLAHIRPLSRHVRPLSPRPLSLTKSVIACHVARSPYSYGLRALLARVRAAIRVPSFTRVCALSGTNALSHRVFVRAHPCSRPLRGLIRACPASRVCLCTRARAFASVPPFTCMLVHCSHTCL